LLVLYYLVVLYVVVYVEELMHHETDEETAVADYRSRQLRHNDSRWASAYREAMGETSCDGSYYSTGAGRRWRDYRYVYSKEEMVYIIYERFSYYRF
jgi:hypothetical protein